MAKKDLPILMGQVIKCLPNSVTIHRAIVLVLTFLAYMSYHMTRKSISVVKTVLHRNCSDIPEPVPENITGWCDWAPFDGADADALLSALDSSFLFAYAIAMFVSGIVADRTNLRYFLSFGLMITGVFCCLLGAAYILNIHALGYFIVIQILFGIAQTTGWPAVIAVVGHWFGPGKRGLIYGIWNSHTSIGNIVGSLLAGLFVEENWSLSFIVPGVIMIAVGILVFLLLVVFPEDVGCSVNSVSPASGVNVDGYSPLPSNDDSDSDHESPRVSNRSLSESSPILNDPPGRAINFLGALKIPGVVEFSLALFFSKLVSYTFLFWLPRYIKDSTPYTAEESADLSTLFDVGGIVGAIVAGVVSDVSHMPASTCVGMLIASLPSLLLYQIYGATSLPLNIVLLMIAGAFVNGPYALITTAVSAELGTHESLQGNAKALATVTAIIDGTGSIGAAVGPLLAGLVSPTGWSNVFYLLIASDLVALILLVRLTISEVRKWRTARHHHRNH